jgi:hypothetical protein
MNPIAKLIRGDDARKSRFHTANRHLCLNLVEFARAFATAMVVLCFKRYPHRPWLVYSAVAHMDPLVRGKRVIEFGSGMSTVWFAARCREVISVEDNSKWYDAVVHRTRANNNVQVIYAASKADYLQALSRVGGKFDVVLIDGSQRIACLEAARGHLNPNGIVIVDNTDADPALSLAVERAFSDSTIRIFRGWVPGILHPNETTIVENIPF